MLTLQKLLEYIFDRLKPIIEAFKNSQNIKNSQNFIYYQKFINEKDSKRFLLNSFFLKIQLILRKTVGNEQREHLVYLSRFLLYNKLIYENLQDKSTEVRRYRNRNGIRYCTEIHDADQKHVVINLFKSEDASQV